MRRKTSGSTCARPISPIACLETTPQSSTLVRPHGVAFLTNSAASHPLPPAVMLMALYLHLGPFSKHVISEIDRRIAELDEMRERLAKYSLSLHPEKTRLIEFGRHAAANRKRRLGKPETFSFPGFIFISGKSRRGKFQIKRKSRPDRMRAKLQAVKQELRRRMHQPIPVQGKWLRQVVKGYFNYHAVPTNSQALGTFRSLVTELWQRSLRRCSQKDGTTWERITRLAKDWFPKPLILHPWPEIRFAVTHPRWEPYAGKPLVRFCAGGAQQ